MRENQTVTKYNQLEIKAYYMEMKIEI